MVMPVIYIATEWFGDVDYRLPGWTGWLGIPLLFAALGLLWRAHADLGRNWSATVRIRAGHALVTDGVYAYVRHPIYAAHWLIVIAQVLLVQNWIAGPVGFLTFLLVYAYRIPREEAMLLQQYGDEYRVYMQHTGRVTPRWGIK
jgi:protein-S-isoprenylcysteine O-methyltransferase Ste14